MCLISSILLAFSASLDSLIIGIAYGIKKIRIKLSINILNLIFILLTIINPPQNITILSITTLN